MNGSPVKPGVQLHIGLWVITWQRAFRPQVFGHGSTHFLLTQALFCGHSELTIHSGWHEGGVPIKPLSQVHTLWPLMTRQRLFGPHGDGWHGSSGGSCLSEKAKIVVSPVKPLRF